MTSLDLSRRAATVLLVAVLLVTVPGIAIARFSAARAPSAQSISTASLVAPTSVTGTFTCGSGGSGQNKTESVSVSVTGFTDSGPAGSTYTYVLTGRGATTSATTPSHVQSLTLTASDDGAATTWTLTIRAGNHSWTGPVATKTAPCTKQSDTGPLPLV